jgi:hypothetical protein
MHEPLAEVTFGGEIIEWRGPSPYYFVPLPDDAAEEVRDVAAMATYGWGVIPVEASIGDVTFETSLFPKDGGYLLPIKDAVRTPTGLTVGDHVVVHVAIRPRA